MNKDYESCLDKLAAAPPETKSASFDLFYLG